MPLRQLFPDPQSLPSRPLKVDIIAVHGLNPRSKNEVEHAWDTWRKPAGSNGRLWLRDDLPQYVPDSRIFLYEYDATVVYGNDRDTFVGKADELLEAIRIKRDNVECRPILLLGHSMGGLLLKQALINAHNNPKYRLIKDATKGLAFFATPHNGGDWKRVSLGKLTARIANTAGFQKGDNVVDVLDKGSIFSDVLQTQWRHQLLKYDIVSFWGALDNVVPMESARLGLPGDRENVVKLNADHGQVCKFSDSQTDQDNFELVRYNIRDLYTNALRKYNPTASLSVSRTGKVWESHTAACVTTCTGHDGAITGVAYSPDSTRIASASVDSTVKIWDSHNGECLDTYTGHNGAVSKVAYSPDGSRIASASTDCTIKVWDTKSGACLDTYKGHGTQITGVAYSSDGTRIASASTDKTIKIWATDHSACLDTFKGHEKAVIGVAFSPDSTKIASTSFDGTVKMWDTNDGACLTTIDNLNDILTRMALMLTGIAGAHSVAYSPNNTQIALASVDKTVQIWDFHDSVRLGRFEGHNDAVTDVAYSPDGLRIVSASADRTVKIWDIFTGACLSTYKGHNGMVCSVAYSPDGAWIASASVDHAIKIWNANLA